MNGIINYHKKCFLDYIRGWWGEYDMGVHIEFTYQLYYVSVKMIDDNLSIFG